jgi:hypothetical protein
VTSVSQTGLTLHSGSDVDYYTFVAANKGTFTVSLTPTQGSGTLSVTVLNARQTVLASGQSSTGSVILSLSLASGQWYYVKVSSPTGSLFTYNLSFGKSKGAGGKGGKPKALVLASGHGRHHRRRRGRSKSGTPKALVLAPAPAGAATPAPRPSPMGGGSPQALLAPPVFNLLPDAFAGTTSPLQARLGGKSLLVTADPLFLGLETGDAPTVALLAGGKSPAPVERGGSWSVADAFWTIPAGALAADD